MYRRGARSNQSSHHSCTALTLLCHRPGAAGKGHDGWGLHKRAQVDVILLLLLLLLSLLQELLTLLGLLPLQLLPKLQPLALTMLLQLLMLLLLLPRSPLWEVLRVHSKRLCVLAALVLLQDLRDDLARGKDVQPPAYAGGGELLSSVTRECV